ncbi:hypothetical protein QJS66_14915 [Kocuria rhizophila]|nr:hypothetical protein QJS66_14915 [Kocuria rhizophila]
MAALTLRLIISSEDDRLSGASLSRGIFRAGVRRCRRMVPGPQAFPRPCAWRTVWCDGSWPHWAASAGGLVALIVTALTSLQTNTSIYTDVRVRITAVGGLVLFRAVRGGSLSIRRSTPAPPTSPAAW